MTLSPGSYSESLSVESHISLLRFLSEQESTEKFPEWLRLSCVPRKGPVPIYTKVCVLSFPPLRIPIVTSPGLSVPTDCSLGAPYHCCRQIHIDLPSWKEGKLYTPPRHISISGTRCHEEVGHGSGRGPGCPWKSQNQECKAVSHPAVCRGS